MGYLNIMIFILYNYYSLTITKHLMGGPDYATLYNYYIYFSVATITFNKE